MKKIILVPNAQKDIGCKVSMQIAERLASIGIGVLAEEKYLSMLPKSVLLYNGKSDGAELVIVVGGDGSVLDASQLAIDLDIPILGVNLGNLGYLAELETSELDLLSRLASGDYKIENKMLLTVRKHTANGDLVSSRYAVNDIILSHDTFVGIAELSLTDSFGESIKYRADGIILSTPAGSTAYSLSAGGPIVSQDIDAIVATPICPHSFFNRSIVFNASEKIRLCNTGKSALKICIDGRLFLDLEPNEACTVLRADKELKMLTFAENNMFATLFGKMKKIENI